MEKHLLFYADGVSHMYQVEDKLHFYDLLKEIDKNFVNSLKYDSVECIWKEEVTN